jgi:hypothetical protein
MNMSLDEIDRQIRQVENRIAVERIALDDAIHGCAKNLKQAVTSPKTLFALLGVGFAVGKVLFKDKHEPQTAPAKKAGVLGLITGVAGTAISLAGSRWGSVARWAAGRYFARRKAAAAPTRGSAPISTSPRTSPAYTRTPASTGVTSSPRPLSAREL